MSFSTDLGVVYEKFEHNLENEPPQTGVQIVHRTQKHL